jgi:hypothetical protein
MLILFLAPYSPSREVGKFLGLFFFYSGTRAIVQCSHALALADHADNTSGTIFWLSHVFPLSYKNEREQYNTRLPSHSCVITFCRCDGRSRKKHQTGLN